MTTRTCQDVVPAKGAECGRPAKGTTRGNHPVCGIHLRAAIARGEDTYPLQGSTR